MRIHTKQVFQMTDSGEYILLESHGYDYAGPVAQCFGGDTDETQTTTTTQEIETTTLGLQDIEGIGIAAGGDVEFNQDVTDLGAIQGAFDFAESSAGQAASLAEKSIAISGAAVKTVGEATRSDTSQALVKIAMFASLAVGVFFVARVFKGA